MKEEQPDFEFSSYEKHYSEEDFWAKMKTAAKKAGVKVVYGALKLYYAALPSETPMWAKAVIYGALGYLILPIDVIPDALPGVGFIDDLAMIATALALVAVHITGEVKQQARDKVADWFGQQDWDNLEESEGEE